MTRHGGWGGVSGAAPHFFRHRKNHTEKIDMIEHYGGSFERKDVQDRIAGREQSMIPDGVNIEDMFHDLFVKLATCGKLSDGGPVGDVVLETVREIAGPETIRACENAVLKSLVKDRPGGASFGERQAKAKKILDKWMAEMEHVIGEQEGEVESAAAQGRDWMRKHDLIDCLFQIDRLFRDTMRAVSTLRALYQNCGSCDQVQKIDQMLYKYRELGREWAGIDLSDM